MYTTGYRAFSLTWSVAMQIYCNKRKLLHKKKVLLPEDGFGTPTWPPFHCFGTQICLLYTSPSPRDGLLSRMPSSA